jgi:HAD superfamily hydrolase (TIGR01509 family)
MYDNFIKKIEYLFDGIVLSYQIHKIKPYDSIYEYIINKYNLNPEESLFIDDKKSNIDTANKFGIKGRAVKPNDVEDVKQVLKEYEVLK